MGKVTSHVSTNVEFLLISSDFRKKADRYLEYTVCEILIAVECECLLIQNFIKTPYVCIETRVMHISLYSKHISNECYL